jgi:hypothetical protein
MVPPPAVIEQVVVEAESASDVARVVVSVLPGQIDSLSCLAAQDRVQVTAFQPVVELMVAVSFERVLSVFPVFPADRRDIDLGRSAQVVARVTELVTASAFCELSIAWDRLEHQGS